MESLGLWDENQEKEWLKQSKSSVLQAFNAGEKKLKPKWVEMFDDVYKNRPPHIKYYKQYYIVNFNANITVYSKQIIEFREHLEKYSQHYPLKQHQ